MLLFFFIFGKRYIALNCAILVLNMQGAMDLYKKQKAHMNGKSPGSSFDGSKLDRAFRASGEGAEPSSSINEKDGEGISSSSKSDLFGDAKERQSCTVSNTVSGHVVSANDSRAFEALMPESVECMVNLSQIHNPPGSTH